MNYFVNCFLVCFLAINFSFAQVKSPRISILTSIFDGDFWIERFLSNITKQTIFEECELILINANSPGNEEFVIAKYMRHYPNIKYIKLSYDPGIYGVWNIGIVVAQAPYLINANLDDLRYPDSCKNQADYLDSHPEIALIFSDFMVSIDPIGTIDTCKTLWRFENKEAENAKTAIFECLPGAQPMWRKSVHDDIGFFDSEHFLYSGDWEFWCRMAKKGYRFAKTPGMTGIYYENPQGLSTNKVPAKVAKREQENKRIAELYESMWRGEE